MDSRGRRGILYWYVRRQKLARLRTWLGSRHIEEMGEAEVEDTVMMVFYRSAVDVWKATEKKGAKQDFKLPC